MIHEVNVRVMARQNQFKLEWRAPNPSILRLEGSGMTLLRGSEPQDDSVMSGRPELRIPWSDVLAIRFNKWWHTAIRVDLRPGRAGPRRIWVQWLTKSLSRPYKLEETAAVYGMMQHFWEGAVGPELERHGANSRGSV